MGLQLMTPRPRVPRSADRAGPAPLRRSHLYLKDRPSCAWGAECFRGCSVSQADHQALTIAPIRRTSRCTWPRPQAPSVLDHPQYVCALSAISARHLNSGLRGPSCFGVCRLLSPALLPCPPQQAPRRLFMPRVTGASAPPTPDVLCPARVMLADALLPGSSSL